MKDIKPKKLDHMQAEQTKKASILDGSAYNVMYGFGEQYVTPFAISLGASDSEIGILSSIPAFIGSLSQVLGAKFTENFQDRKKIVLWAVFLQAITIVPLFIVPFLTKNILALTVLFSLYLIFANIGGPAWNSWIGAVIPDDERTRYFAKRNKISIAALLISVLIAGIILNYFSNASIWTGFAILFCISFLGRMTSWYFQTRQYEPKFVFDKKDYFSFTDFLKRMSKTNFGNFVIFRSLMAFAIMIASPFFAVYMLRYLDFSYIQYTIIILVPMVIKILTMTYWGKYAQRFGNKRIMFVSAFLIALIPFWWFIAGFFLGHSIIVFYFLIFTESLNGFAWAGFDLTTFNYMLETSSPQKRARAFAYFNVIFGTFVMLGGILGAILVGVMHDLMIGSMIISAMLLVFLISTIARGIVALTFVKKMDEIRINTHVGEGKLFFDLVVAKPMHSALAHTAYTLNAAEENIERIEQKTKKTLQYISSPAKPIINDVAGFMDKGLESIEPIRKGIEPAPIRRRKKLHHQELIGHDYSAYIKSSPKIIKKLDRKRQKHKKR